jgi:tetratricopeptide (TPR) repeat protein
LEAIVAESPDFAPALAALGSVLHRQFYQLDSAIKVLRKAANRDPGNSGAAWELSDTYADLGMRPEAGFWDERLDAISPDPGSENYYRGYNHQLRGETKEMIAAWESSIRAHEVRWESASLELVDYDLNSGHPEVARARFEQMLPDPAAPLTSTRRRLTVRAYACAMLACGERERAQPYVDAFLKHRDATNRLTWAGVGFQDAAIFLQMGDQAAALAALHEFRGLGGCVDLTQYVYLTPLFDNADFQALNKEMLAELEKQRANLARMEAAGELAPIPPLSESSH